ncbi:14 kDa proline-rich protein DC2.15-like [Gastrolobium bilobum]|uniref:14 kDa proline-rich protein DC2.15-like n=1 Tax=Gastrolobium bilobum TaxID=150636 RepID=UPI002AB2D3C9|nr:14 kDa proline-rich protein DC2.15-like [Gastrolobium bilobum]
MAPKTSSSLAIFLLLNILFFAHVSACVKCPPKPPSLHKPKPPSPHKPNPPKPPKPDPSVSSCPRDSLKLGVCSSVLDGKFNFSTGAQKTPCCSFFEGLASFDAAVCLCTALKANVCGININIPISFTFLFNFCSKKAPSDFLCLPDN